MIKQLKNSINNTNKQLTYIDLFSGAGGFSLGFDRANFKNIFSLDIESEFCKTYKAIFSLSFFNEYDIGFGKRKVMLLKIK